MIPVNTSDPEPIGSDLAAAFPDLGDVPSVRVLKDGFRNVVVETPCGHIFKIARSWEASATFSKEVQCLPLLAGHLPVGVPRPGRHLSRSTAFPFGVAGYKELTGVPLASEHFASSRSGALATDIGECVAALHAIQPTGELSTMLPGPDVFWYELQRERDVILPLLRDEMDSSEYDTVAGWWETLMTDARMRHFTPVVAHGDVEPGNLLVDAQYRLVGLLDFEGLAIGDPARDLAPLLELGRDFALATIDRYHAAGGILDENYEYRVQRHWELRGFSGMRLAIHYENQREFDRSLARLRRGPLLNEVTRRETQLWPPPPR